MKSGFLVSRPQNIICVQLNVRLSSTSLETVFSSPLFQQLFETVALFRFIFNWQEAMGERSGVGWGEGEGWLGHLIFLRRNPVKKAHRSVDLYFNSMTHDLILCTPKSIGSNSFTSIEAPINEFLSCAFCNTLYTSNEPSGGGVFKLIISITPPVKSCRASLILPKPMAS